MITESVMPITKDGKPYLRVITLEQVYRDDEVIYIHRIQEIPEPTETIDESIEEGS